MDVLSTADKADTAHTKPMSIDSLLGSCTDSGMVGQSQIVVGAEVKNTLSTFNFNLDILRARDDSFDLVSASIPHTLKSLLAYLVKLYMKGSDFFKSLLFEKSLLLLSCIISYYFIV